ncbi:MAG: methyltransferase domain-containing protein [Acidimicrobiia bacterium]|nr:methyltransferase domain-containing protein [Acidimicrobiia bacterium]
MSRFAVIGSDLHQISLDRFRSRTRSSYTTSGAAPVALPESGPSAEVIGLDISSAMSSRDSSNDPANIRFELGDIAGWEPSVAPDLIFSNAVLHWLPDHEVLFPRLVGTLSPGGTFMSRCRATSPSSTTASSNRSSMTTAGLGD